MEVLQLAFWKLDSARTIGKFEQFGSMAPNSAEARMFIRLEDWANDGAPLPAAAAREMIEGFFREDNPGRLAWTVGGHVVDPTTLACPQLHIASTVDRIVPHGTAVATCERLDLAQGHVGMVVGSRALTSLWQPLESWLSSHISH